ncbi:peptidoglycan recognition protein family protein [Neobacillus sp. LXY-4]|uniref:peptidoglycan recognition protein family protein n=1 Tax=Neobacillus sp. LXY-4 TaxID=3379826 RepID=UPI003EE07B4A
MTKQSWTVHNTMKKLIEALVVVMLLFGLTLTNIQSTSANSTDQADTIVQTETTDFSIISVENGKSEIFSPAPGKFSTLVYANFEKSGEYILYNNNSIYLYSYPNGKIDGGLGPQVVHSKQRKGQWFLIDSYLGPRWVYNDENVVELRDLYPKNAKLTLEETVNIYSEPFTNFKTEETIAPSTVNVVKQAGNWYLVDYNSQQVWITTLKAHYEDTISTFDTTTINGVPFKKMFIPTGNKSVRPETTLKPDYITVHNTANTAVGANAEMHAKYLINQAQTNPESWVSWHFTVDDTQIIQHLPLNESGFHAGDDEGPGNRTSIGIEITENVDGNYQKAEENARKLIAYLMDQTNIPIENIKPHRDWSGKYCPRIILNNGWSQFISLVKQEYGALDPQNRYYAILTGAFLGEWKVKEKLDALRAETGWWATYEPVEGTVPYYRIRTGEFTGENNVAAAIEAVKSETGWWMTYEKTTPAFSMYRIVTGEFVGEENIKSALEGLQRDTNWWAYYEPTSPGVYRIVTGGFAGDEAAKIALERVITRGWWATSQQFGEPIYNYRIRTGDFLGDDTAKQALEQFTKRGWWAAYEASGGFERYYRIRTGAFAGLDLAEKNAQWVRDTRGWWVTTQQQ